jgi:hypothetical protein
MIVAFVLLCCVSLLAASVILIGLARRASRHPAAAEANFPRWAVRLGWLLGIEFALFGVCLALAIAHAAVVYMAT